MALIAAHLNAEVIVVVTEAVGIVSLFPHFSPEISVPASTSLETTRR